MMGPGRQSSLDIGASLFYCYLARSEPWRRNLESLAYVLLPLLLALTGVFVVRDRAQYAVFKTLSTSQARQAMLRRWVIESFFCYGVTAVVCLLAIGHASALHTLPDPLRSLSESLRAVSTNPSSHGFWRGLARSMSLILVPALLFGHTAAALIRTYGEHKRRLHRAPGSELRDIEALFPRNAAERRWTTALSINAGLSEELFFRALAPLLIWIVTGSGLLAVLAATAWFGLAHAYQGVGGILISAGLGAVLMTVYLYTGSIWLVVLIHAVLDLNDLALAPWFKEILERAGPSTSA